MLAAQAKSSASSSARDPLPKIAEAAFDSINDEDEAPLDSGLMQ